MRIYYHYTFNLKLIPFYCLGTVLDKVFFGEFIFSPNFQGSNQQLRYRHYLSDILISNPYGGGPQIILDVAVTGVTGQSRRSDTGTDQPLEYRFNQKKDKYAQVAQDNGYLFIPAIFSHTGQIHKAVLDLMSSQIFKHKLELDDPQVQSSKIKSMLNLWVKQLSCVINRTAARNIMAGKAALVDAVNAST